MHPQIMRAMYILRQRQQGKIVKSLHSTTVQRHVGAAWKDSTTGHQGRHVDAPFAVGEALYFVQVVQ